MAEIKKTNAEETSYLEIVKRKGDIKIPLIQRDYAQGRPGKKVTDIRERFVKDIFKRIIARKSLNLDFVYGATDGKRFIPLDGQQRLTTLFLIHLYLDGLRGPQAQELDFLFTYETRDSSRLFCEKIVANRKTLFSKEKLEVRQDENGKDVKPRPSDIIKDQPWWLKRWITDPTVDGMLRMLDTIDSVFFDNWETAVANLFSADVNTIKFQFLKLENFYDPDDLFIKMNARGLPLTEFEIFKGKWIEQIEKNYPSEKVKEMKTSIDVHWTDFFWPMRRLKGLKNIDSFFRNILKFIIGNATASLESKALDFDILFEANKKDLTFSYGKYTEDYHVTFNKELLDRITEELTVMCNPHSIFSRMRNDKDKFKKWLDLESEWDFFVINDRDNNAPNYKGRGALYAISRLSHVIPDTPENDIQDWARLVYHLLENTRIDASVDAVKVIKDIDTMLQDLSNYRKNNNEVSRVNNWCAQSNFEPAGFNKFQWQEEKIKTELRKVSDWDDAITEAECHKYLSGKICTILWCSGEIGPQTPFDTNNLKRDLSKFELYKDKYLKLMDQAGDKDSIVTTDYLLVRALLSKDDYMPELSADRRNIYNNPTHRDYSWKAIFNITDSNRDKTLTTLKSVLDDPNFNSNDISGSLQTIIKKRNRSGMKLWRRILTSPLGVNILKHSGQGFLAFADGKEDNVLIYGSSQRNGYHYELNTLYIETLIKTYKKDVTISATRNIGSESKYGININDRNLNYWDGKWFDDQNEINNFKDLLTFIRAMID